MTEQMQCRIEEVLGHAEACPGEQCPFWDGDAAGGGCSFRELDLAGRDQLAGWLHDLRGSLESVPRQDEAARRRAFWQRTNVRHAD